MDKKARSGKIRPYDLLEKRFAMTLFQLRQTIFLLITATIWGLSFVAQSVGMDHVGPFTFTASRMCLGALSSSNDLFADYRHDLGLEFCCPVGRDGPRGAFYVYGFAYVFGRTL